jgi:hypothetical protein
MKNILYGFIFILTAVDTHRPRAEFKLYPGIKHTITKEMMADIMAFLKAHKEEPVFDWNARTLSCRRAKRANHYPRSRFVKLLDRGVVQYRTINL